MALIPARPVDLRAKGEGVVEYPGKVACPSGRRCSTRNAVWCHSHPGFKSQRYRHCRPAPMGPGGFVMPGWCVGACVRAAGCCWCSGRRRAWLPAWCALLGRAAWCARGRWATWLMVSLVVPLVFRVPSGPAAREIATREPAARSGRSRSPPVPSVPSGALHTGGACVAVTSPARPYRMGTAAWVSGLSTQWCPVADADWCVVSKPGQALPPPTDSTAHGFHSLAQQVLRCPPYWSCNPLRVAVRSRFAVVSCPKCRPPRRKTLKTGCYGRSGLRFERIGTCHSALLAREPAIASVNPLCRT